LHTLRLIARQPWRYCVTSLRSAHWLASSLKLAVRCPVSGCWPSCVFQQEGTLAHQCNPTAAAQNCVIVSCPFPQVDIIGAMVIVHKGKERKSIYIAPFCTKVHKALRHGSRSFTCKQHHACLSFVAFTRCHHHSNWGSRHPVAALLIYRPRKDETLSWPSWLTYSGWLTHISGHPSATSRAQDSETTSAKDQCSTARPRHQTVRGKIIGSVLCNIVCNNCAQYNAHTYQQTYRVTVLWIEFCLAGPNSLFLDSVVYCVLLYIICMHRFVTWWSGPGGIEACP